MAVVSLIPSSPNYSEASQIIETVNTLVANINSALSNFGGSGNGNIFLSNLANTDPHDLGVLWVSSANGALHVSQG